MITFKVDTHYLEELYSGATDADIIVTIAADASDPGGSASGPRAAREYAEVILLDCSASMNKPPTKLAAARASAMAAIDCLRDGAYFAVVRGTSSAHMIYPPDGGMAAATPESRRQAKAAVSRLSAEGGTVIGRWLELARDLLATRPHAIRHVILLTDGRNEHQTPAELAEAVTSCEGVFQCDCRAVGRGWQASELSMIATTLLGSAIDVPNTAELAEHFREMTQQAMGRELDDVFLRVWTPRGARVRFLKQVVPWRQDLTDRARRREGLVAEYPTGAWGGTERRDYHLGIGDLRGTAGDGRTRIARVSLVAGGEVVGEAAAYATWTHDQREPTRANSMINYYSKQEELTTALQEGLAALRGSGEESNEDEALRRLGHAARLAAQTGDEAKLDLIAKFIDIVDAESGSVRLRERLDGDERAAAVEAAMLRSEFTTMPVER